MLKRIFFSMALVLSSNQALATNYLHKYNVVKDKLEQKYKANLGLDITYTTQNINSDTTSRTLITP